MSNSLPAFRAPLVDMNGLVSREWLAWFQQLQDAGTALSAAGTSLASLQAAVTADAANVATLAGNLASAQTALTASLASLQALQAGLTALQITANQQLLLNAQVAVSYDVIGAAAAVLASSLQKAANLSDVASALTSRANLAVAGLADANVFAALNTFTLAPVFTDAPGTRTALGLGTAATQPSSAFDAAGVAAAAQAAAIAASCQRASNLSDVASVATARTNLGLGTAATTAASAYDASGAATAAQAAAIAASCQRASNLSDVATPATALANLGGASLSAINTFASTQTFAVAPVFTAAALTRTALGLGAAALLATPIPIASGGTGAASFAAAFLPVLNAANIFAGTISSTASNCGFYATTTSTTASAVLQLHNDATASGVLQCYASLSVATYAGVTLANWTSLATAGGGLLLGVNAFPMVFATTATERMRIAALGDVLIGTTTDNTVDKLQVSGNVGLVTAGNGLKIKEGSNARSGTGTLVAGTVTIANTSITANTRVQVTGNGGGVVANFGALYRSAIVAGTSFTVKSTNAADTATFDWLLVEAL